MSIRQALRRQTLLASEPRRGKSRRPPEWWCGSNAILALMAVILAVLLAVEMLRG